MGGDRVKEVILDIASRAAPETRLNVAREYLQARILHVLQVERAFIPLAFMGGTALRFAYQVQRYSEDMDFTLVAGRTGYDLERYGTAMKRAFEREGYDVRVKLRQRTTVQKVDIRFYGVPFDLGLSPHLDEVLMIRIEVDTNPPEGAVLELSEVWTDPRVRVQHHDRASLFAGKVAAMLARPYLKGRDVYDVDWMMGFQDWPPINETLLHAALAQSENAHVDADALVARWPEAVLEKLEAADWDAVEADVAPFLASEADRWTIERDWVLSRVRAYAVR
jgi:hypothetical protein